MESSSDLRGIEWGRKVRRAEFKGSIEGVTGSAQLPLLAAWNLFPLRSWPLRRRLLGQLEANSQFSARKSVDLRFFVSLSARSNSHSSVLDNQGYGQPCSRSWRFLSFCRPPEFLQSSIANLVVRRSGSLGTNFFFLSSQLLERQLLLAWS